MSLLKLARTGVLSMTPSRHFPLKISTQTLSSALALEKEEAKFAPSPHPPLQANANPNFRQIHAQLQEQFHQKNVGASMGSGTDPSYSASVFGFKTFELPSFRFKISQLELPGLNVAYETWGTLNKDKSNAILLQTGLSASSHAKSHEGNPSHGWWEQFIGEGKALDTSKYFIICVNNLGSCYGSSGPASFNPETQRNYATTFPLVSVEDIVRSQFHLLDHLGISKVKCVGSSLGGMQALLSAALFPDRVSSVATISSALRAHPQAIAIRAVQRRIIMADPLWNNGNYYQGDYPLVGMKLARELGTVSYRSGPEWELKFGQNIAHPGPSLKPYFEIESYLDHQGTQSIVRHKFDPNSLIYLSKAMDMFNLYHELKTDKKLSIDCPTLVIGVESDILFPISQQREISHVLREKGNENVTLYELDALYGHDTFLIDIARIAPLVHNHLASH